VAKRAGARFARPVFILGLLCCKHSIAGESEVDVTRAPVALKIALAIAVAITVVPGSPNQPYFGAFAKGDLELGHIGQTSGV